MSNAEYLSRPFPLLAKLAAVLRNIAPVRKAFIRFATLLRGSKKSDEPLVSEFVGEIPDVAGEIPGIIDKAPAVADKAPEIADETPGGADQAPDATDEAPAGVADGVPEVAGEAPEVTDETPGAADEAPDAADEAPAGGTDDVPGVADEVADVTDEPPGLTDEADAITDILPDVSEASEPLVVAPAVSAEAPLLPECTLSARAQLIRRRWAETGIKMWAGQGALNIQGSAELLPLQPGAKRREYDRLEFRLIAGDIVCEGVVVDPPSHRK